MTNLKAIVSAGMMLVVTGVALADPSLKLLPAGAKAGQPASLVVKGYLGGATSLTAVEIHIKVDTTKLTVAATPAFTVTDPNWGGLASNLVGDEIIVTGAYNTLTGQTLDGGVICTITGTLVGGSKAVLTGNTNVADQNGTPWYPAADQASAVINGAVRDLGAPIVGSPSTGPGKVVAVAAGTTLKLLMGSDLTDVAGFTAPTVGTVSGRPAFGMVGAQAVIAVGDDAGKLTVVDAATGAAVGTQVTLAGKVSTPAIAADVIYAGVTPATGKATLVKVVAGVTSPVVTLAGTTVLGSPAVYQGLIVVGTDAGVETFRTDGTQQAIVADAAGATIAPIIGQGGRGLSANATKLLGFNALTGAAAGAAGATGGAVSEAWYEASTDMVVLGTASGKILEVNLTSGTPTLAATAITAGAVTAEPIVLNGVTYVIDATGNVASSAGLSAPLGAAGAKALAATGLTAGTDSLIAATATGVVASLAL